MKKLFLISLLFFASTLHSQIVQQVVMSTHSQFVGNTFGPTNFPATENPLSQSGAWLNGAANGTSWNNCQSKAGGLATGTGISGDPPFTDNTCVLNQTWGWQQTAQATIVINNGSDAATQQEIELRLNSTITAGNITGYEFDCNIRTGVSYCIIVKWNGLLNNFCYISGGSTCQSAVTNAYTPHNGDVIVANNDGAGNLTLKINGTLISSVTDTSYQSGSPGMGFWQTGGTTSLFADFGLTNFSASGAFAPTSSATHTFTFKQAHQNLSCSGTSCAITGLTSTTAGSLLVITTVGGAGDNTITGSTGGIFAHCPGCAFLSTSNLSVDQGYILASTGGATSITITNAFSIAYAAEVDEYTYTGAGALILEAWGGSVDTSCTSCAVKAATGLSGTSLLFSREFAVDNTPTNPGGVWTNPANITTTGVIGAINQATTTGATFNVAQSPAGTAPQSFMVFR